MREPRDLGLPGGEPARRLDGDLARGLAGGQKLSRGALGELLGAHGGERVVRSAQLLARVHPPTLPARPLAVGEMRWARASHARTRVRVSRSIASRYRPSATSSSLSRACA